MTIKVGSAVVIDNSRNIITPQITFSGDSSVQTSAATSPKTFAIYSTSSTFTVPAGITTIYVMAIGGGRGGSYGAAGGTYLPATVGTYGTTGAAAFKALTTTPGTVYTFTIGAGGAANASTGGVGSNTVFNTTIIGGGGGTAVASGGDINNLNVGDMIKSVHQVLGGVRTSSLSVLDQITFLSLLSYRPNAATSLPAVAYTFGDAYYPGAGGSPSTVPGSSTNATGGVGGAVVIFY